MAGKSNSITRDECLSTHEKLMEKIDGLVKTVGDMAVSIASLPGDLTEKLDQRYANKNTEKQVEDIKTKMEARNYEWLKYLAGLIIGAAFSYLWAVAK